MHNFARIDVVRSGKRMKSALHNVKIIDGKQKLWALDKIKLQPFVVDVCNHSEGLFSPRFTKISPPRSFEFTFHCGTAVQ